MCDEQDALRIACPEDPDAFQRYLAEVALLKTLPKAHLHIHTNAIQRNGDVKRALAAFNEKPGLLMKAREDMEKKAAEGDERARLQLPLIQGDKLCMPDIFWTSDGLLKSSGFEPALLDAAAPFPGLTGWNEPENLWHGMGGCRDYNFVVDLIGEGLGSRVLGQSGDKKWLEKYIGASEDARSEGIRWIEYCGANGAPKATEDMEISNEDWVAWRDPLVSGWEHVRAAVPEVGLALVFTPPSFDAAYSKAFVARWSMDAALQDLVRGVGEVGAADPSGHAQQGWKVYIEAGMRAVNVHVGEWCPERPAGVEEALRRVAAAVDMGASRIGHGTIAHADEALMAKITLADVCLEVCITSNRVLDNLPRGLASHPIRALYDAGVPCVLAADDPSHCGAPNGHGLLREFLVAREVLGFSKEELVQLAKNSFTYSLAPEEAKKAALADIQRWVKA